MHEPIIDEDTFNLAQKMTIVKRMPVKKTGAYQIFVGLLRCGTCNKSLSYARSKGRISEGCFACSTFRRYGKSYCSMHYITYENLYKIVLDDIKKHIANAKINKDKLIEELTENSNLKSKQEYNKYEKDIKKSNKRFEDIELIIQSMYEDKVLKKISEERFISLTKNYEKEQKNLKDTIIELNHKLNDFKNISNNLTGFTDLINDYIDMEELNSTILNSLIDKIVVHECTYEDNIRKQQIDIYYNFVGMI